MKQCPNCQQFSDDAATFCAACGAPFGQPNQAPQQPFQQPAYAAPAPDPYDHTAEFNPKDISENKVFAMACYLLGAIGILMALFVQGNSPYVAFHLRQALKITMVEILTVIVMALLVWTIIVPIVASIFLAVLSVISIICFFQVCSGKAKEPAIVRSIGFLK